MLIAQITDTHIGTGERSRANDERMERVVSRVAGLSPDLVVVTGDLTDDGSVASYKRFTQLLAPLGGRLLLTLGNHDRREAFFSVFADTPNNGGFAQHADSVGPMRVVMLDTLDEGWDTAGLCPARIAWLDACLSEEPQKPTLLALHHPPARTGVAWIDVNADGRWAQRLADVVTRHRQIVGLIAGHVHRAVATQFAGRPLIVSASSAYQVAYDPRAIDPAKPDGRALISAGPPGFAMHQWTGQGLISWFGAASEEKIVARFDASTRGMIVALAGEAATHDA